MNIEGAFIDGADFCLLQRGNAGSPLNACIRWPWHEVEAWLRAAGPVLSIASISRFDLVHIGGVPLGFTDAAVLPGGGWVFCAAAEDTDDSVADGPCESPASSSSVSVSPQAAPAPASVRRPHVRPGLDLAFPGSGGGRVVGGHGMGRMHALHGEQTQQRQ